VLILKKERWKKLSKKDQRKKRFNRCNFIERDSNIEYMKDFVKSGLAKSLNLDGVIYPINPSVKASLLINAQT